jgi:CIC family chloride channel protein
MGAVFAGVIRTPMTSVLMIFELTQDYAVIVPLMIANLVSLFVASQLQRESIYEVLTTQDGIHLPSTKTRMRVGRRTVGEILRTAEPLLPVQTTVGAALAQMRGSAFGAAMVMDGRGVVGVVGVARLESEAAERVIGELVDEAGFAHLHADQGIDLALERMGENALDAVPVVSRAEVHRLLGMVTLNDVLGAYGVGREDRK